MIIELDERFRDCAIRGLRLGFALRLVETKQSAPVMGKETDSPASDPPRLTVSREEADQRLRERIQKGEGIRDRQIHGETDLDRAHADHERWSAFNVDLLKRMFTNYALAEEYSRFYGAALRVNPTHAQQIAQLRESVGDGLNRLESIRERLEFFDTVPSASDPAKSEKAHREGPKTRVFVVHGHDEAAKEIVARFLERLELQAVILHEQASRGRTVMEKLEGYSDVDFAVVLLTPDDLGSAKSETASLRPRARQNVVLELGYFIGLLGREHVCALHKGGLELPSDFGGVVYVSMDDGSWKLLLARELIAAGFTIDMNRTV